MQEGAVERIRLFSIFFKQRISQKLSPRIGVDASQAEVS
jgi:hypothetical protein